MSNETLDIADDGDSQYLARRSVVGQWDLEVLESPVQALDVHLRHWEWMSSGDAEHVIGGFLDAYKNAAHAENAPLMTRLLEGVLDRATTTYVDGDVSDLLYHQGLAMPPDMLRATDAPYPEGFLVLAKVWEYMDFSEDHYLERKIPIRAIAWWETSTIAQPGGGPHKPGMMVALFADHQFIDIAAPDAAKTFYHGSPPGLFLVDLWAWTYDTWWKDLDDPADTPDQHHASPHVGEMRRVLLTTWRFMQEEIVRTERVRPPRPAQRRWNRANIANIPEDGCITSLHLRRYAKRLNATDDEEREAREICWSHRWWVTGHYRHCKKCGVDHPRHKHEWVRPYIKGPDDAPLVLKERLVSVER